jgi:hypothetical protein
MPVFSYVISCAVGRIGDDAGSAVGGIVGQLAVLDDANKTGSGQTLAEVRGMPGAVVAEKLTGYLGREIMPRGLSGDRWRRWPTSSTVTLPACKDSGSKACSHGWPPRSSPRRRRRLTREAWPRRPGQDARLGAERHITGGQWSDHDLVFSTRLGGALDAANVRREFKAACRAAKIGGHWTPRELRHSFVSLVSSSGVPVEEIARLAGHSNTRTTEVVYRRELRPVLTTGAEAMDRLFQSSSVPAAHA